MNFFGWVKKIVFMPLDNNETKKLLKHLPQKVFLLFALIATLS